MEPVGHWPGPSYAASFDRRLTSGGAGDTPSTILPPPHLLLPSAYNSVLFNQQSTYQQNSTFSTNSDTYHHSTATSVTASNPYYGTHGTTALMGLPSAASIPAQLGSQFQSSYEHARSEVVTHSSTTSTSNSTGFDNYSNPLFCASAVNSQLMNLNYNDKNSNLQTCGVSTSEPKDNFYSPISHSYQVPNTLASNNFYNLHETTKNCVIVTESPSLPLSAQPTISSLPSLAQHQNNHTIAQFQPTLSTVTPLLTLHNNSKFSQPINTMNSKEFQSPELASKVQHSTSVSPSQLQNNLYEHSSKTPAPLTSYQHTINENRHNVYNNRILAECSSPSPPVSVPMGGLPTHNSNLSSNKAPLPELSTPDQRSSIQTGFTPSLSPGYRMPLYSGVEYPASPQQGFHTGRAESAGSYSPCSRQQQSPVQCPVTSPSSTHFQTSPSYPSHNSPVTSHPTYKLTNFSDTSALRAQTPQSLLSPSQTKDSARNLNQVAHLNNQQYYWQDSDQNLQKADSNNYDKRSPSYGNAFERNSATDNSYLHPMLKENMLSAHSDPISSITKVTNSIEESVKYLPTGVTNPPEAKNQINCKQIQADHQSKNSIEQNVSNNGSNPFERSSAGKFKSPDDSNQFRFNNPTTGIQNSTNYVSPSSILPNASSQIRNESNMNQILQGNSQQCNTNSNSFYNPPSFNGNNTNNIVEKGSGAQNAISDYPSKMHLPHCSMPKKHENDSLATSKNSVIHVTNEAPSITSTTPEAVDYAKHSMNASSFGDRGSCVPNEIIKTVPFHNVNQSLMVSQRTSHHTPNVNQTQDDSKTCVAKLPSISISTENDTNCSSYDGKKNVKSSVGLGKKQKDLSAPVANSAVVKPAKKGRPPNIKQDLQSANMPEKKPLSFPPSINNGFMASYIKFLEGIQCDLPDEAVPTPKKEVRPQKREVPSTKKELPSTKKEVPSAKKEVPPPKKEVAAARRSDESDEAEEAEPEPPPKREPSTRRARRKSSLLKRVLDEDEEDGVDYNSANSDSDPAWSPAATKDDSDEDFEIRSERRTRRSLRGHTRWGAGSQRGRKRGRSSIASSNDEDDDDHLTSASKQRKYPTRTKSVSQTENKTNDGEGMADFIETSTNKSFEVFPFQVGEFVMNKSDVNQKNHPIWRVDGKTLLQKYQATVQKGEIIYKNIPTYSGWTHRTNNDFQKVEVKIISQHRNETVVQLLVRETEELIEDQKAIDKYMEDYKIYQDAFEIYIQTLISQVLDSNFLMEIIRENDTYFLNSVKTIDEMTCDRRKQLSEFAKLQPMVEKSVATWPCIDVLQDSPQTDADISKEMCASCPTSAATKRVIVFGQPYNSDNLEGCPPDPEVSKHKNFLLCKRCIDLVTLFNKIVHQKYQVFISCANKVQEKRTMDPAKDTTVILNELLADEPWISQSFKDVSANWAKVEMYINKKENEKEEDNEKKDDNEKEDDNKKEDN